MTNGDTQINMQQLEMGMYIIKVSQNNQELKTFKIIKK
ncbi:T9SS type A sorting domain-containing protein [Psychroflexus sp. MES1-P1E]|nr:T9SS type A sorting domain-containing protein [Psychroflexus sp. MES1-P1E]